MSLLRAAARSLLASVFVVEGLDAVKDPYAKADSTGEVAQTIASKVSSIPSDDPALLVRANGAVQVGAGLALIGGRASRPAAMLLATSAIPTAIGEHRFWEAEGEERGRQLRRFLTRAGLIGGLLVVAMDTEGKPGVAWKTAWAMRRANELADHKREIVELKADLARERARAATAETRGRVAATGRQARRDAKLATRATRSAGRAASKAGKGARKAIKAATPG